MTDPKRELLMHRELPVPRSEVWKAWTDPGMIKKWWGPDGVTIPTCEFEVRPGGKIYIEMLAGESLGPMKGQHWPMHGVVRSVAAPEELVFTATAIENPDGTPNLETRDTVTIAEHDGKTRMTVHVVVTMATDKALPALAGMETGWNQQLDKLVNIYKKH